MTLSTHGHGLAMGMCEDCLLEFKQGEVECVMTTCSMLLAFFAECVGVAARRRGCEVHRHTFEKSRAALDHLVALEMSPAQSWEVISSPVARECRQAVENQEDW